MAFCFTELYTTYQAGYKRVKSVAPEKRSGEPRKTFLSNQQCTVLYSNCSCSTLMDQQLRSFEDRSPQFSSSVWPNHRDQRTADVDGLRLLSLE